MVDFLGNNSETHVKLDINAIAITKHKSHLLMNVLDMGALEAEMTSDAAKEWDKKNDCKDTVYAIELVD